MRAVSTAVCPECSFNLPYHDERCSQCPPLVWACAEHRPAGTTSRTDDGARKPCSRCGQSAKGYR